MSERNSYNWKKLKKEYMLSDTMNVSEFMRENKGTDSSKNSHIGTQTKGWKKEKKELIEKLNKEIDEEVLDTMTRRRIGATKNLINARLLLISKLTKMSVEFNEDQKKGDDYRKLRELLEMVRTEMGEPTMTLGESEVKREGVGFSEKHYEEIKTKLDKRKEEADDLLQDIGGIQPL